MQILGLHINTDQTAAALVVDGSVRFAAAEERFDRMKRSRTFPKKAINFCLSSAGLRGFQDLDGIAVSWNPAENMRHINLSGFTSWRRYDPEWLYIVPNQLMSMAGENGFPGQVLKVDFGPGAPAPLYFVNHHWAHMAHAVFQCPFERGAVAVVDEYGEFNSATLARFTGNRIEVLKEIPYPHSLGVFFAAVTEFLGFTPNSDEWKVMGAAACGDPSRFSEQLSRVFPWDEARQEWVLDQQYIEHANMKRAGYCNERFAQILGLSPRHKDDDLTQEHFDLASAAQAIFEDRLFKLLRVLATLSGEHNLAAAGGSFMNSSANGRIIANTPFKQLFVPYAAADNGGAMGAALYVYHVAGGNPYAASALPPSPYLGPDYSEQEIQGILQKFKLQYERPDDIAATVADSLVQGRLVGWFQGRMEFGERALGARSILADPRDVRVKDTINRAVKYRESFRPFAPSVLEEKAAEYFELPPGVRVPYMEQVYPVRPAKRATIPAVTHVDGSGRLQTVSREMSPLYHRLITEFEKRTGVPVILNTSFNVQGEPIVCSPEDAVRTFYSCGLDCLAIGPFWVRK